jgi:hypothetical protein
MTTIIAEWPTAKTDLRAKLHAANYDTETVQDTPHRLILLIRNDKKKFVIIGRPGHSMRPKPMFFLFQLIDTTFDTADFIEAITPENAPEPACPRSD